MAIKRHDLEELTMELVEDTDCLWTLEDVARSLQNAIVGMNLRHELGHELGPNYLEYHRLLVDVLEDIHWSGMGREDG